jgi:tripartite-type tricarboxylate transporter receptor subunit TctC
VNITVQIWKTTGLAGACLLAFGAGMPASAQTPAASYPNQMVRIVVPFSAGSATDLLARTVGDQLAERWKQQVIVENRPGMAGTAAVAKAPADGYTLMLTSNGHTVAGVLNKSLPFDPVKDFSGVSQVASVPLVLIVYPELPAKTLKEFIALAKEKPGALNFASPGLGSTTFIAGALFKTAAKIDLVHVPYKGAPESVTSVVRGDSHMYFTPANVGLELVSAGKVRALAVTTPKRLPTLPDVPTFAEAGLPEFSYDSWFGVMAPTGVPAAILQKASREIAEILKTPDIEGRLSKQGITAVFNTPEEFDKIIRADTARFAEVFKDAGVGAK